MFAPKTPPVAAEASDAGSAEAGRPSRNGPNLVLSDLSAGEIEARRRALEGSKVREVEDRQRAIDDAKRRLEDEERRKREREESARRQAEEEARLLAEAEIAPPRRGRGPPPHAARRHCAARMTEAKPKRTAGGLPPRRLATPEAGAPDAHQGRGRPPPRQADAELGHLRGGGAGALAVVDAPPPGEIQTRDAQRAAREGAARSDLPETITIADLANRMSERAVDIVKFFMKQGQIMKPGDVIDADTAELVASEFGHTVRRVAEADIEEGVFKAEDKAEDLRRVRRS